MDHPNHYHAEHYPHLHPQQQSQMMQPGRGPEAQGPQPANNPPNQSLAANQAPGNTIGGWFEFSNASYMKGMLIGAGATLLLTNPGVQKALFRGSVKLWSLVQGGVEEVKEQFQDIKAEMSQEE
jgi:hypothetical protein